MEYCIPSSSQVQAKEGLERGHALWRSAAPAATGWKLAVAAREAAMDVLYSACTMSPACTAASTARAASLADTHAALALCGHPNKVK